MVREKVTHKVQPVIILFVSLIVSLTVGLVGGSLLARPILWISASHPVHMKGKEESLFHYATVRHTNIVNKIKFDFFGADSNDTPISANNSTESYGHFDLFTAELYARLAAEKYFLENAYDEDTGEAILSYDHNLVIDQNVEPLVEAGTGGPSAGLMFALEYLNLSTGNSLTAIPIAGTGTIDPDGNVGAVGMVDKKISGIPDNIHYFFVSQENMNDPDTAQDIVVAAKKHKIQLVVVNTLDDAVSWLCANATKGNALCVV